MTVAMTTMSTPATTRSTVDDHPMAVVTIRMA
jgi:hypothetical protein